MFRSLLGNQGDKRISSVNTSQIKKYIEDNKDLMIIDVRSPYEYEREGHIKGALLMPLQDLMHRYDELPKDQPLLFVCRSGNRSHVACEQMVRLGYTDITNYVGGMLDWKRAGFPVE